MPEYNLQLVKQKVKNNEWHATSNAINRAWNDFGWDLDDMATVLKRLRLPHHFHKTDPFRRKPHILLDTYKAVNIKDGEDVYIHLYIRKEDGKLVVNSFHQLNP